MGNYKTLSAFFLISESEKEQTRDNIFPCRKEKETHNQRGDGNKQTKEAGFGPCRREKKIRDGGQFQGKRGNLMK